MKKAIAVVLLILVLFCLAACGAEMRTVHCDRCGKEVQVTADSNITDDWIILCKECKEEPDQD